MQEDSQKPDAPPGPLHPIGSVVVSIPFEHSQSLIIRAGDSLLTERIWLNRGQAMHLLEILPEWIAKLPVSPNVPDQRPGENQ